MSEVNCTFSSNEANITENKFIQISFLVVYFIIFLLGISGNVLVCYVVLRIKSMQTVTNLFITNLALSDILLCIFAVPFTPLYTFLRKWVFGSFICHLVPASQGISVYISTLTLTSIAIDRYIIIKYPFRPRMKNLTCTWIILFIWIFSILATLPYGIYMSISHDEKNIFCEESWPNMRYREIFSGLTTLMQFVIPFILIAYCYICVMIKLNHPPKMGLRNAKKEAEYQERKKRTNLMLIAMVVIFLISWLPLNIINIIFDFDTCLPLWDYYLFTFLVVHAIAMSSTCYNPFLYAWLNENFRREFKNILPCFKQDENSFHGDNTQHTAVPIGDFHTGVRYKSTSETVKLIDVD